MSTSRNVLIASLLVLSSLAALPAQANHGPGPSADPHPGEVAYVLADRTVVACPGTSATCEDSDNDGLSEIFGTGAVVQIRLNDADLRGTSSAMVQVRSATDTVGESVALYRSDKVGNCAADGGDCLFFGTVGVEPTVTANNGRVAVAAGQQLILEYSDSLPGPITRTNAASNFVEWKPATNGALSLDGTNFVGDGTGNDVPKATVTVTDTDRNLRADVQDTLDLTFIGDVANDPAVGGLKLSLCERGVNSGIFEGVITFTTAGGSTATGGSCNAPTAAKLLVQDGSRFMVEYEEEYDARGAPGFHSLTASWRATDRAVLDFVDSTYRQVVNTYHGVGANLAGLRLEDPDLKGAGLVNVRVTSVQDPVGINVQLTEGSPGSGEFVGTFGFSNAASGNGNLFVASTSDTLTAAYTDAQSETGASGQAKDNDGSTTITAGWVRATTSTVRFMDGNFTVDATSVALNAQGQGTAFVEVIDLERDTGAGVRDTVWVRMATPRDPVGLNVTLKEAQGLGGYNTGVFRGCFHFQSEAGGNGTSPRVVTCYQPNNDPSTMSGLLLIRSNDVVTGSYLDDFQSNGNRAVFVTDTITVTGGTAAPSQSKGTVQFFTDNSYLTPATSGYFGLGDRVFVQVNDQTCNYLKSPSNPVENLTVYVSASFEFPSRVAEWHSSGARFNNDSAGRNEVLTLIESAPGSGLFRGEFGFAAPGAPAYDGLIDVAAMAGAIPPGAPIHQPVFVGVSYNYPEQPFVDGTVVENGISDRPAGCGNQPATPAIPNPFPLPGNSQEAQPAVDRVGIGSVQGVTTWTAATDSAISFKEKASHGSGDASLGPFEAAGSAPFVGTGQGFIQLFGTDLLEDTSRDADAVNVRVTSTSDPAGIQVQLRERYVHAFDVALPFDPGANLQPLGLHQVDDDAFRGAFTFSTSASNDATDTLKVAAGDRVEVSYLDPRGANGESRTAAATARWIPASNAAVNLDQTSYRGDGAVATIVLSDADRNLNSTQTETVTVRVISTKDPQGIQVTLNETAPGSGVFHTAAGAQVVLDALSASNEGTRRLAVADGDVVEVLYEDRYTTTNVAARVTTASIWYAAQSGILQLDNFAYVGTSAVATVTLDDPDRNTNGTTLQQVQVFVFSSSDGAGEFLTLSETGINSHVFTGTFGFETSRTAGNQKVRVSTGDLVVVYYFDEHTQTTVSLDNEPRFAVAGWTLLTNMPPTNSLGVAPTSGLVPLDVVATLGFADADGTIASFSLDWGDGTTPLSGTGAPGNSTPQHTYASAGNFTVTFTVTDNLGATATKTVLVAVGTPTTTSTTTSSSQSTTSSSTSQSESSSSSTSSSSTSTQQPTPPTAAQILAANNGIELSVTPTDAGNVLEWTLPSNPPAPVEGVQLWASNSPYTLLATIYADDPGFGSATFTHSGPNALASTRYLVTMFYGPTSALGFFTGSVVPDTSQYAGTAANDPSPTDDDGLPLWAWILIVLGVVAVVLIVVLAIVLSRRRQAGKQPESDEPVWEQPKKAAPAAASGTYEAKCPSCATGFSVTGAKPIVTVCPGCGRKGILR